MTFPRSILYALPCCLALFAFAGCERMRDLPGEPDLKNRPVPSDQITEFAPLYGMYCAGCHGADGRLGPAPPLNDALFLAIVPDEELLRLVDVGRPGTPMPGFSQQHGGPLTKDQVRAIAEGIKPHWVASESDRQALAKIGGDLPAYAVAPPTEGAAAEAASRGEKLFGQACAKCHGAEGKGAGAGRLNEPDFLDLASNQLLRRIIITGRPDLGMPNFATADGRPHDFQPLSSADIDDLVMLLGKWREEGRQSAAQPKSTAGGPATDHGFLTEINR